MVDRTKPTERFPFTERGARWQPIQVWLPNQTLEHDALHKRLMPTFDLAAVQSYGRGAADTGML